jgi:hypothetical protein
MMFKILPVLIIENSPSESVQPRRLNVCVPPSRRNYPTTATTFSRGNGFTSFGPPPTPRRYPTGTPC